jgi:LPS-assembly protein
MPCYGCQLKLSFFKRIRMRPTPLSNTNKVACHAKILATGCIFVLLLLGFTQTALPQATSAEPGTPTNQPPVPPPPDQATAERPDFTVKIPRINPPAEGDYDISSDFQESEGGITHLHGHVVIELFNATFKADEGEYNESTKIFKAHGNVYYRNYNHDEVIYCDEAEYNTDTQRGTFRRLRGYTKTKVVARPGLLTTQQPFYFEAVWAEKIEDKYLLHDGIITDCHIPHPWWVLHSNLFDIIPDDRAVAHNAVFHLHRVPIFFFPYFYKALKKEPRKSGFLTPEAGHSSQFGYFFGAGYYWAINRSYDLTYLATDYTSRGVAQHIDIRGKPTQKSDFNLIASGIDDHGSTSGDVIQKAPGASVTGVAKTEFGDGWIARGNIDYISSYLYRQVFSGSFSEAIYSSTNSTGFLAKNFSYYSFDTVVSRNQDFLSTTSGDVITIRKLPEFELAGRDQQFTSGAVPLWFSFDSSFGLYHRSQSTAPDNGPYYETSQFTPRGDLAPSVSSAFQWQGLSIVPTFTMHETLYGQSLVNSSTVVTSVLNRTAPEINIDLVLPSIERIYNKKTFLGDKLKHVIEPRIGYDYVTGVDNFLNTLRFDQRDLLADTNEFQFGLINRLYAKKGTTIKEVLTWEVAYKRFLDPTFGGAAVPGQRNVLEPGIDLTGFTFINGPRHYSPITNVVRIFPRDGISIRWMADYDPLYHTFVNSMLSTDVRIKKYFVSVGSNILKPPIAIAPPADQVIAQLGYGDPNRKGWNAALSTVYDFHLGYQQFAIIQVTYNTDCCGFSAEYRRFDFGAVNDSQYKFSFSIANIGTFGNLKKQERIF